MAQRNEEKAAVLYDFLDRSQFFTAAVRKEDRSLMNVPFCLPLQGAGCRGGGRRQGRRV